MLIPGKMRETRRRNLRFLNLLAAFAISLCASSAVLAQERCAE